MEPARLYRETVIMDLNLNILYIFILDYNTQTSEGLVTGRPVFNRATD